MPVTTPDLQSLTTEEFRTIIGQKALERSTDIFKNGSTDNANIVAANIFKYADSEIRIYADNMNGDIGDCQPDYQREAEYYLLKPGTKLTIVLEKIEDKKSQAFIHFLSFSKSNPDRVKIYKASKQFSEALSKYEVANSNTLRFMTGDKNQFRLQHNNLTKSAYFSFNNNDITKILVDAFDKNIGTCELVN